VERAPGSHAVRQWFRQRFRRWFSGTALPPDATNGGRNLTPRKTTALTLAGAAKAPAKRAPRKPSKKAIATNAPDPALIARILKSLDDDKAEDIVTIDLEGRSSLADALVIATGRSARHVASTAEHLARRMKEAGYGTRPIVGLQLGDWVLVDAGDVIVHLFRQEVRDYYDLEGMWSVAEPERAAAR
jgi:ribosome-associated protein